jgi:thiamine-monophosphate kinase
MIDPAHFSGDMNELGEKAFLSRVLPALYADPRLLGGFGHDAAVIELPDAPFNLIMKVDRASYPVAVRRGWSGYKTWGQMAITANCSDILASGGRPLACMVAVMAPGSEKAADVQDIILGASDECRSHGVVYAGGDTKETDTVQVVGAAVGVIAKTAFLPRTGVRPGDELYCAGRIGGFAGAFLLLEEEAIGGTHDIGDEWKSYIGSPVAQWIVAGEVNKLGIARCGMDASDGMLDVLQTFASSGVQVRIDLENIPYHPFALECAEATGIRVTQLMFGGGDWNILYCMPPGAADKLMDSKGSSLPLFRIGEIGEGSGVCAIDGEGREWQIAGAVNEHFRSRIEDAGTFMDVIKNIDYLK